MWRLLRLVRHFFISQVESNFYAVNKNGQFRYFPKNATFLNSFPKTEMESAVATLIWR